LFINTVDDKLILSWAEYFDYLAQVWRGGVKFAPYLTSKLEVVHSQNFVSGV